MSDLILNLDELNVRHEKTEEMRRKIFEEILKNCHNKIIKYNTEFKKYECIFQPPVFIIGRPPYNYIDLVSYLITSLIKNGLRAEWLPQKQAVYISWKKNDVDMNQYHAQTTQAISNHVNDQSFAIFSVRQTEPDKPRRKKKNAEAPPPQHVAMLEYRPGVKDYVPINIHGLT